MTRVLPEQRAGSGVGARQGWGTRAVMGTSGGGRGYITRCVRPPSSVAAALETRAQWHRKWVADHQEQEDVGGAANPRLGAPHSGAHRRISL